MIVLGIEAATPIASVGIVGTKGILAEKTVNNRRTHSVNLLPMVKEAIGDAQLQREDIEGIAVSAGPGSFTGLRIGMAIAKTLSQAWNIPIVGVSTLDSLAQSLAGHDHFICPLLNARKNEAYTAIYKFEGFDLRLLEGPVAADMEKLVAMTAPLEGHITFLGEAVDLYRQELSERIGGKMVVAPMTTWFPRAAILAYLGRQRLLAGGNTDYYSLLPHYIRLSEAEVKWQERQKR
ncbi:MAG TPA: tRNA (adenosine(37)-N6)-threonylcarbamoyltransferase complex dimerization subunit type 1 TsaB [Clostridia bacterium]|nr:tRNA (adenosine(37)-N6)-threonylcarbamoyltransferase complex dimerization subunit type 1 TsaB [Clostridia bacterium]